jgi:molybdate transport system substrate-binding protein
VSGTLRLLSGGAAQGLVEALRGGFEARAGWRIEGAFGAVGAMRARLLAGEPADLVILSRALVDGLARHGRLRAESVRDVGTVRTAIAVRQGDPLPAIATADDLRLALRAADEIHFPDPEQATAGIHFAALLRSLGVWDGAAGALRPAPNGRSAMGALAASAARRPIGCTQATEILATAGVVLAGPLPAGCELATTYAAAVTAGSIQPAAAASFIALLVDPALQNQRRRLGFD